MATEALSTIICIRNKHAVAIDGVAIAIVNLSDQIKLLIIIIFLII